jgi:hypothetical protein
MVYVQGRISWFISLPDALYCLTRGDYHEVLPPVAILQAMLESDTQRLLAWIKENPGIPLPINPNPFAPAPPTPTIAPQAPGPFPWPKPYPNYSPDPRLPRQIPVPDPISHLQSLALAREYVDQRRQALAKAQAEELQTQTNELLLRINIIQGKANLTPSAATQFLFHHFNQGDRRIPMPHSKLFALHHYALSLLDDHSFITSMFNLFSQGRHRLLS